MGQKGRRVSQLNLTPRPDFSQAACSIWKTVLRFMGDSTDYRDHITTAHQPVRLDAVLCHGTILSQVRPPNGPRRALGSAHLIQEFLFSVSCSIPKGQIPVRTESSRTVGYRSLSGCLEDDHPEGNETTINCSRLRVSRQFWSFSQFRL